MSNDNELLQKMAVKQAEIANDVKHIVKWSESHDKEDKDRFDLANKKIDWVMKFAHMSIGGMVVLQVILHFIK